jgi:hypothetical protein
MQKTENYKIVISDKAKQMLGMHIRFISQVNKEVAIKTRIKIISSINSLSTMPQRYPFLEEAELPKNKYHKMYITKNYLVLYQVKDDIVYVDYIMDTRQEYHWLVK